jgi:hypothetical protein
VPDDAVTVPRTAWPRPSTATHSLLEAQAMASRPAEPGTWVIDTGPVPVGLPSTESLASVATHSVIDRQAIEVNVAPLSTIREFRADSELRLKAVSSPPLSTSVHCVADAHANASAVRQRWSMAGATFTGVCELGAAGLKLTASPPPSTAVQRLA